MGLSKEIILTVKDYEVKLNRDIKFYENDTIDLCFSILEYGIEVKDGVAVNKLMPINALKSYMLIETPQGVDYAESTKVEDNRVVFNLGNKYSQFIGIGKMQIVIKDNDGCRVTLPEFPFEIRESINSDWDKDITVLSTEENEIIIDEFGRKIELKKISEMEETNILPINSYSMILDNNENKKIKTNLITQKIENDLQLVNEQLDSKVNKNEITNNLTPKGNLPYANLPLEGNNIGDYYFCSDGVNGSGNYVWNGTSWYFGGTGNEGFSNVLNFLKDCYIPSNNLFNVETKEDGYYLNADGSRRDNTNYFTSDWIKVDGDKTVYLTRTNPNNNVTDTFSAVYIVIYDAVKNVVGASSNFANNVALPSNAKYIRFSANINMLEFNLMVCYTENTPYEDYDFYSKYNTKDYYSLEKRVDNLENVGVELSTSYWHGKTMIAYGDSITAGYRLEGHGTENTDNNNVNVYGKIVADELGMKWINMGRSGYGYSLENSSTGSNATNIINMFNNNGVADVVLLAYGTNDFGLADTPNVPFGEINSNVADTSTFCNSVRSAFNKVLSKFTNPETIFLVILPLPRATQNTPNHTGKTLFDYAEAIKQIATRYNFPVLDLLTESNITVKRDSVARKYYIEGVDNYPTDALHLTLEAHRKFVAPRLKDKLIELSLNN